MHSWKRTLWILWAGVLLCSSSYSMAIPFLPLFLYDLGVDRQSVNLWAGIVHSSAFLVGAFMAPVWGSVADKYGKKKMVVRAGLSLAVVYSLIAFVDNVWQLMITRLLHGFVGGFVPASMSIVASVAPQEKMGWSLGMMQAGTMTGGILGPLFGGLFANWFGLRASFVVAGACILVSAIAVVFWVHEGKAPAPAPAPARKSSVAHEFKLALRNPVVLKLLLLLMVFQLSYNMVQPLLTLHIADLLGTREVAVLSSGVVLAVVGIAGIISSPLWGRAGMTRGYVRIISLCLYAAGSVIALQYFIDRLWLFTLVQFVFGFFLAGVTPAVNTLVVRNTANEFRGRSFGLTTSANQLGMLVGPLIGGALSVVLNIHWMFVIVGCLMVVTGLVVSTRFADTERQAGVPQRADRGMTVGGK